jgi:hypothetical protein
VDLGVAVRTEIMEILASYDLTRTAWSAAQLVGCDPKTVQRYVDLRDAGLDPFRRTRRARLIDPHLGKVEELVEDSHAKIRADVVHDRLRAMGFAGNEPTRGATLVFLGSAMLFAAARGAGGCEILALSNWLLRRDDQIGCPLFWPVDTYDASAHSPV